MTVSRELTRGDGDDGLTVERISPCTKYDTLSLRLVFLEVQQMTYQHLDLRSVTPEAWHFADSFEEIRVNIVIRDDASGLGSRLIKPHISSSVRVGGVILNVELLQLVFIDGKTKRGF